MLCVLLLLLLLGPLYAVRHAAVRCLSDRLGGLDIFTSRPAALAVAARARAASSCIIAASASVAAVAAALPSAVPVRAHCMKGGSECICQWSEWRCCRGEACTYKG